MRIDEGEGVDRRYGMVGVMNGKREGYHECQCITSVEYFEARCVSYLWLCLA